MRFHTYQCSIYQNICFFNFFFQFSRIIQTEYLNITIWYFVFQFSSCAFCAIKKWIVPANVNWSLAGELDKPAK